MTRARHGDAPPTCNKQERRQRRKALERFNDTVRRERRGCGNSTRSTRPHRGRRARRDVTAANVSGMKYVERLLSLREPLRDMSREPDKAGNQGVAR